MPGDIECPECDGWGEQVDYCPCEQVGYQDHDTWSTCERCDGSGWIPASELRERGEGG